MTVQGGGGESVFWDLKFWPKVNFLVYERCWHFFVPWKNTERFFGVAKKGLRDFLGYAKKCSDFFG